MKWSLSYKWKKSEHLLEDLKSKLNSLVLQINLDQTNGNIMERFNK